jgi:hypothetical protein
MARENSKLTATVGVTEHGNSAILVTVASDFELIDRRRIDLTHDLPTHPYHHEGSWAVGRYRNSPWAREITLPEAVELVAQVEKAATLGACAALEALATDIDIALKISCISLRVCPELPATIQERIVDNRAQSMADSVMYRQALATAAEARGWSLYWYDRESVFNDAATRLGSVDVKDQLSAMGKSIGPPWQAKHKLAAAAALAAMTP